MSIIYNSNLIYESSKAFPSGSLSIQRHLWFRHTPRFQASRNGFSSLGMYLVTMGTPTCRRFNQSVASRCLGYAEPTTNCKNQESLEPRSLKCCEITSCVIWKGRCYLSKRAMEFQPYPVQLRQRASSSSQTRQILSAVLLYGGMHLRFWTILDRSQKLIETLHCNVQLSISWFTVIHLIPWISSLIFAQREAAKSRVVATSSVNPAGEEGMITIFQAWQCRGASGAGFLIGLSLKRIHNPAFISMVEIVSTAFGEVQRKRLAMKQNLIVSLVFGTWLPKSSKPFPVATYHGLTELFAWVLQLPPNSLAHISTMYKMFSTYFILLWSPNAQNWSKLCCNPPLLSRIGRQQLKKIYKTCLSTQTIALQSHNSLCWYFPAWQGAFTKHLALDRGCTKFCFQVVRWTTSENQFFCIDARQSWQLLINLDISLCKPGNSISDTTHAVETSCKSSDQAKQCQAAILLSQGCMYHGETSSFRLHEQGVRDVDIQLWE